MTFEVPGQTLLPIEKSPLPLAASANSHGHRYPQLAQTGGALVFCSRPPHFGHGGFQEFVAIEFPFHRLRALRRKLAESPTSTRGAVLDYGSNPSYFGTTGPLHSGQSTLWPPAVTRPVPKHRGHLGLISAATLITSGGSMISAATLSMATLPSTSTKAGRP